MHLRSDVQRSRRAALLIRQYGSLFGELPYRERRRILELAGSSLDLAAEYGDDPVRFGWEVLGESYTSDIAELLRSAARGDRSIVVARSATAVGKTHAAGAFVVWWALCRRASQSWICAAPPEGNLLNILWPQVEKRYWTHKYLFDARGWVIKSLMLTRPWRDEDGYRGGDSERPMVVGVRIPVTGTSKQREAKFSGKHSQNLLFVVDEGDAVPDEVYRGIDGCMSGGTVSLLVLFNPREQSGPVWEMEREGIAHVVELSALRHPNVLVGEDLIPGAVTRNITVRRMQEWSEPCQYQKDDATIYQVPDWLVGAIASRSKGGEHPPLAEGYRRITNPEFAYKVLGQYSPIATFDQVFDTSYLRVLRERVAMCSPLRVIEAGQNLSGRLEIYEEPVGGREYVLAADPSEGRDPERGDYSVFDVVDISRMRQVAHYRSRCDPHTFAGDIAGIGLHYNNALVVVERNNHGHAVIDALVHTHEYPNMWSAPDGTYGMMSTAKTKAENVDAMRGMLTAQKTGAERGLEIMCLETVDQMLSFGRLGGSRMGGKHGANDDAVTAICMAYRVALDCRQYTWNSWRPPDPLVLY